MIVFNYSTFYFFFSKDVRQYVNEIFRIIISDGKIQTVFLDPCFVFRVVYKMEGD